MFGETKLSKALSNVFWHSQVPTIKDGPDSDEFRETEWNIYRRYKQEEDTWHGVFLLSQESSMNAVPHRRMCNAL